MPSLRDPKRVPELVRRVVIFNLSLTAPWLAGCGGTTAPTSDAGASPIDASTHDADAAQVPLCTVVPGTETTSPIGPGCEELDFQLNGTSAQCGGDSSTLPAAVCARLCPSPVAADASSYGALTFCGITPGPGPTLSQLWCEYGQCITGRRPAGLRPERSHAASPVQRFLAGMAHLEAAAVPAFERLERELAAHGAPARLLASARRGARDERRHARIVGGLARRAGAVVARPRVRPVPVRPLLAVAIDNAVEGCVYETFAAAVAVAQSLTAGDEAVRRAMETIAQDELRHADLAWRVAGWIEPRLDAADRSRLQRARTRAVRALEARVSKTPPAEVVRKLGLLSTRGARAVLRDLEATLWAA